MTYCQCGCGGKAPIAKRINTPRGVKKGEPYRFIHGHGSRKDIDLDAMLTEVESGCWEWQGSLLPNGYGIANIRGRRGYIHRLVYEQATGDPIPKGMVVMHTCDNRRCANPDHLRLGTQADNMRDAVAKKRVASGERNGRAKLTEAQAKEIRQRRLAGERAAALAAEFGVSRSLVDLIRRGLRWPG